MNREQGTTAAADNAAVVAAIQASDEAAFGDLVEGYRRQLHVHCYRMLGSFDDAEDLVQETLLRAWRARATFEGRSLFRTWLYRIALNHTSTRRKSLGARQQRTMPIESADQLSDPQPGPAETLEKKQIRERVQNALSQLDPEDAKVLLLRDLQDIPYDEVARVLEIPVGTVKSRLHRARQALKARLAPYFYAGRKAI